MSAFETERPLRGLRLLGCCPTLTLLPSLQRILGAKLSGPSLRGPHAALVVRSPVVCREGVESLAETCDELRWGVPRLCRFVERAPAVDHRNVEGAYSAEDREDL